jgi:hypothetical protein
VKQTAYELLALLDRNLRESVNLFKQLVECPGQRSDVLTPLSNTSHLVSSIKAVDRACGTVTGAGNLSRVAHICNS